MKFRRIMAIILCFTIILSGCATSLKSENIEKTEDSKEESTDNIYSEIEITDLWEEKSKVLCAVGDETFLTGVEETVYIELLQSLDPETCFIEEVTTSYISKEYIKEVEYNSKSNIFFGYTLDEINEQFLGEKFIFTLGEDRTTVVKELDEVNDNTYNQLLKNVAVGGGVILVSVTIALLTKNPAAAVSAGKAVKVVFALSSKAATSGTMMALSGAGVGAATSMAVEAIETGDMGEIVESGLLGASEGFKYGAIVGSVSGIVSGIYSVGNIKYFQIDSPQALKYPSGVEFTKAANGKQYPRFEKWAIATAKFDIPSVKNLNNKTGLSGVYAWDAKLANAQCGFSQTPAGYVWHHVEDMKTMILIPQDLHSVAFGGMWHYGGASLIRELLKL